MKFRRRLRNRSRSVTIDVTPMMDAAFILIIFLLITTAFKKKDHAFQIELPRATEQEVMVQKEGFSVFLTQKGDVFLQGSGEVTPLADRSPLTAEALVEKLRPSLENDPDTPVNLVVDEGTEYQKIIRVINAMRKSGVSNLQLPYEAESPTP